MQKIPVDDLKRQLNPSQWDAVTTTEGPVLVVAGAGTGKTRVIEYRCLYMISRGILPESILLLTFTRKAAREMLSRASLHDARCRKIEGGTFHSFAYRLIHKYKKALGLNDQLSFIDEDDSASVLHLLAGREGLFEEKTRAPKKDTLRNILSMSINRHQTIAEILSADYPHFAHLAHRIEDLRKKYAEYKIARNLVDYDDMLIYLKFLLEDPAINRSVCEQFRYVMVDEFQDTNRVQADIVYLLAKDHHNCLAVGDDTQSIYSFRGAYYKNMFQFPKRFPDTKIIKLEYNYRSTQPVLDVANAVIESEKQKYAKALFTTREGEDKPTLSIFKDAYGEADWVAQRIKEYRDAGVPLSGIGVLYRSNFLSLPVQLALSRLNIPFAVYGGMKFIETAHIKDVLSFLKVHHNPHDEIAWARVLMLLEGVGPKTAEKVREAIVACAGKENSLEETVKAHVKNPAVIRETKRLAALMASLAQTSEIDKKIKRIIHFYTPFLKEKFDDYPLRQEDLEAFRDIAASYTSLEQFLVDFITLEPPERSVAETEGRKEDEKPIVLSTVHSAKGLEWEAVFVIALMDGSLPVSYALDDEESIEEERRLLYVAVTRAKKFLHLSMHNEGRNGGIHSFNRLSRFISEPRVMEKLERDHTWYDEEAGQDEIAMEARWDKRGLYDKLVDYFGSNYGEDHF